MAQNGLSLEELAAQVQQLGAALQQSQQQNAQLQQQVTRQNAQVAQLMQAQQETATAAQQAVQQVQGTQQLTITELNTAFQSLTQSQKDLAEAMRAQQTKKFTLIDTKGLAKPDRFSGSEESFLYWRTRIESFLVASMPEMEDVFEWIEEFDGEISKTDVQAAWGAVNPSHKAIEGIEQADAQFHALLQTLCEKEAFTVVRSAGKNRGFEGWCRLLRRFDPSTGNRRRAMLRHILTPTKVTKVEDLSSALEAWEETVRVYECRRKSDGTRHELDEEIKVSVLEALCPQEIERHLQLNRQRYSSYSDVRGELMAYVETKLGTRIKAFSFAGGPNDSGGPAPMDVGGFEKGKGKGKSKSGKNSGGKGKNAKGSPSKGKGSGKGSKSGAGKESRTCHNCGKVGHLQKDCWSAGGGAANKGQQPKGKAKVKPGPNKNAQKGGKGVGNLEEEPEAETAETGFLSIAALDKVENEPKEEEFEEVAVEEEFVQVAVDDTDDEEPKYTMVKPEEVECTEPCDACLWCRCGRTTGVRHHYHECNTCQAEHERAIGAATKRGASKTAIREEVKWRIPEAFHYVVDKTICLAKGISLGSFHNMKDDAKEKLRRAFDPGRKSRDENPETLRKIEAKREESRIKYFERLTGNLLHGASRTFGSDPSPAAEEPSRASSSTELPARQTGADVSTVMHRTIEMLEVTNLDAEKREKYQELEEAETEEEQKAIERRIEEIDQRKALLKEKIREDDQKSRKEKFKLSEENLHDQSWHDARYWAALKAGASHSQAWAAEKKRRKATLHRKGGMPQRTAERPRLDAQWHAEFDTKKVEDSEYQNEAFEGLETEAVVVKGDKMRVLKGEATQVRRGALKKKDEGVYMKSARKYRRLTQDEIGKFTQETKEDEMRVMKRARVDIRKARARVMTKDKKLKRSQRVKQARKENRKKNEFNFYLNHPHDQMRCFKFKTSFCQFGNKCKMQHSEVDREYGFINERMGARIRSERNIKLTEAKGEINSFESVDEVQWSEKGWTKLVVNFDTGAAITAVPKRLAESGLLKGDRRNSSTSYKTASGELLEDEGGVLVKGYDHHGRGRSVQGRLVNVHRTLGQRRSRYKEEHGCPGR